MLIEAGEELGHYRLIEQIGEGGMGVVWKAEDTRLHRFVALKFVPEEEAGAGTIDRQLREARTASALNHPNICSIHDIVEWEGRRFIVMELLEGRTLAELIGGRPMAIATTVDLGIQIADALAAAHTKGIVHRDIKTANIFVVDDAASGLRVKLLDFGLAKLTVDATGPAGTDSAARTELEMTRPGTLMGTAAYMSPEQALGKELDPRTDIFSLGVVLYEMTTGKRAFVGNTSAAVFDALLNRAPTAPVELNSEAPVELERIINKSLEKDPALRYQSAAGVAADLRRLQRDSSSERASSVQLPTAPKSGRGWVFLSMMVALLIVVLMVVVGQRKPEGSAETPATDRMSVGSETDSVVARSGGPSIAVLPFTNAGGDPDQEYFSDGLTEDITTGLSRYKELSVIARSSTERYKRSDEGVREIGAALEARYVLQGSVRRSGDRIRVGVELSDSVSGRSVWGNSYERDLTARDLFELQDDLTQQVVNAIAGSYGALARAELPGARRKPPASLDSYDCVLRVYEYLQAHTAPNHLGARDCLERVVEADPEYAEGMAWLAYIYAEEYHHRRNERPDGFDPLDRALELAEKAVILDGSSHVTHGALMLTLFFRGEDERGKIEAYRTIELSPNNALNLALTGTYLAQLEDFEHGVPMVLRAIELTPYPPAWYRMAIFYQRYQEGRYEEALAEARALDLGSDFRGALFIAASFGQLGRIEEAQPEIERMLALWGRPASELHSELTERHAFSADLVDHLMEGVEKAGLEV